MKKSVLLFAKDGFLILGVSRRGDHKDFGLPGGKIEDGETPKAALVREVKEETSLDIAQSDLIEVFSALVGGNDVTTFALTRELTRREVVSSRRFKDKSPDGGLVKWVTPSVLERGSFGAYNHCMLRRVAECVPTPSIEEVDEASKKIVDRHLAQLTEVILKC